MAYTTFLKGAGPQPEGEVHRLEGAGGDAAQRMWPNGRAASASESRGLRYEIKDLGADLERILQNMSGTPMESGVDKNWSEVGYWHLGGLTLRPYAKKAWDAAPNWMLWRLKSTSYYIGKRR